MDKILRDNLEGGIDALKRKIDRLASDRAELLACLRDVTELTQSLMGRHNTRHCITTAHEILVRLENGERP